MARRITPSQFKNMLRKTAREQKRAIDKYNHEVKKYNQEVKRVVNKYNREVNNYNSKVRTHRQQIQRELNKLKRLSSSSTRYKVFQRSVYTLHDSYIKLEERSVDTSASPQHQQKSIYEFAERENANNLKLMNALLGSDMEAVDEDVDTLQSSTLNQLKSISSDLDNRWEGALFSLSPHNPDASRHFCTSAREIFTQIMDIKAPDDKVLDLFPECDKTGRGKPTRRSKIKYLLHQKGIEDDSLEEFAEQDINNILELFRVFNDGTHGSSGKFTLSQLLSIKRRVEDGIGFLVEVAN